MSGKKESREQPVGIEEQMVAPEGPVDREQAEAIANEVMVRLVENKAEELRKELEAEYQGEVDKTINEIASNFTKFLYLLMRDEIPIGKINGILKEQIGKGPGMYSDDILRVKAESLAIMIVRDEYLVTEVEAAIHMPDPE